MRRQPSVRTAIAAVGGMLLLAACGGVDPEGAASAPSPSASAAGSPTAVTEPSGPFAVEQIASSPLRVVNSGIVAWRDRTVHPSFPEPLIDLDAVRSGGPPPDGIPPVDEPRFLNPGDVDFLADNEPVLALEIDGEARAYPVQILTWHEIVNDTLAGIPVTVTYCPLCNSALAYDRRVTIDGAEEILDFGTSGLLLNSSLVMYDRQTETLWSHFTGQAVLGELTGIELEHWALSTLSWSVWRDANPDGLVLSTDTGFDRAYGRNPYPGYDDVDGVPFLFQGDVDGRYTALTRIVGIERNGEATGIPLSELSDARVLTGEVGDTPFVAWWTPGTASALDSPNVADGYDVGATGVFMTEVGGTTLTFAAGANGVFVDDQTRSSWNVLGQAVGGELEGSQLEALPHVDTFWFAWSTFRPDTALVTGNPEG